MMQSSFPLYKSYLIQINSRVDLCQSESSSILKTPG